MLCQLDSYVKDIKSTIRSHRKFIRHRRLGRLPSSVTDIDTAFPEIAHEDWYPPMVPGVWGFQDFQTFGAWRWQGGQLATFIPWGRSLTAFCYMLSRPQNHNAAGSIKLVRNLKGSVRNRPATLRLVAQCSVPRPKKWNESPYRMFCVPALHPGCWLPGSESW